MQMKTCRQTWHCAHKERERQVGLSRCCMPALVKTVPCASLGVCQVAATNTSVPDT